MCEHIRTYVYDPNAPGQGCKCMHLHEPERYPSCICPKQGAWVCSVCGELVHPLLMKSCGTCQKGINEPVSYSQHFHDDCAPDCIKFMRSCKLHD